MHKKMFLIGISLIALAIIGQSILSPSINSEVNIDTIKSIETDANKTFFELSVEINTLDYDVNNTNLVAVKKVIPYRVSKEQYAECQYAGSSESECLNSFKEGAINAFAYGLLVENDRVTELKKTRTATYDKYKAESFTITKTEVENKITEILGTGATP